MRFHLTKFKLISFVGQIIFQNNGYNHYFLRNYGIFGEIPLRRGTPPAFSTHNASIAVNSEKESL